MNSHVLLVTANRAEIEKAREQLGGLGLRVVVATNYVDAKRILEVVESKIVGIISDLIISEENVGYCGDEGLGMIAQALLYKKNIVVCTNLKPQYVDHVVDLISILEGYPVKPYDIPLITGGKDWLKAGKELLRVEEMEKNRFPFGENNLKKFLFITDDEMHGDRLCKGAVEKSIFDEAVCASHGQALLSFIEKSPTHILISDFGDKNSSADVTWKDFFNSVMDNQVIHLCGPIAGDNKNIIQLPISYETLAKIAEVKLVA